MRSAGPPERKEARGVRPRSARARPARQSRCWRSRPHISRPSERGRASICHESTYAAHTLERTYPHCVGMTADASPAYVRRTTPSWYGAQSVTSPSLILGTVLQPAAKSLVEEDRHMATAIHELPVTDDVQQPIRGDDGATILGPRNIPLERENPDILASPYTDAGTIPNLKFSFSAARNRLA